MRLGIVGETGRGSTRIIIYWRSWGKKADLSLDAPQANQTRMSRSGRWNHGTGCPEWGRTSDEATPRAAGMRRDFRRARRGSGVWRCSASSSRAAIGLGRDPRPPPALGGPRPLPIAAFRRGLLGEHQCRDAGFLRDERVPRGPARRDPRAGRVPQESGAADRRLAFSPPRPQWCLPPSLAVWAMGWPHLGVAAWWLQLPRMKFLDPDIGCAPRHGPAASGSWNTLIPMLRGPRVADSSRSRRPGSADDAIGRLLSRAWVPFVLALPTALILWAGHRWIGLDAVLRLSPLVPARPVPLGASRLVLRRRGRPLPAPRRPQSAHPACWLAAGTDLAGARDSHPPAPPGSAHPSAGPGKRGGWPGPGAACGWLVLFGLLGLAQRFCRRPSASLRYLADSSYWIYLVHFPVVGLAARVTLAREVSLSGGTGFLAVLGVGDLASGLGSYQTLVRHTWLGRWLNGPTATARPLVADPHLGNSPVALGQGEPA